MHGIIINRANSQGLWGKARIREPFPLVFSIDTEGPQHLEKLEVARLWKSLPSWLKVSHVTQYIGDIFQQHVIGYVSCNEWPAQSSDLNPLDPCHVP
ncbi:hypothetical protein TNCV_1600601 [Trichonephila clavipes]|nr:hypothetical protein TNCV_1600601 [Trichonephila clavipes]